jgi:SAM-dependent methyltransferase
VLWAAANGYQVTAIDFAPEAIVRLKGQLDAAGLQADLVCADLFDLPDALSRAFDLVLEQTCFCAIDPIRRAEYVTAVHRMLVPGGRLAGLFYRCGGDSGPPFNTEPDQVRALFDGLFVVDSLAPTPHSHERRSGEEWLGMLTRR